MDNILDKNDNLNFYEILGITKDATNDEIKTKYLKYAKIYHPDKYNGDPSIFRHINKIYETLMDPEKRKNYDDKLNQYNNIDFINFKQESELFYQSIDKSEENFNIKKLQFDNEMKKYNQEKEKINDEEYEKKVNNKVYEEEIKDLMYQREMDYCESLPYDKYVEELKDVKNNPHLLNMYFEKMIPKQPDNIDNFYNKTWNGENYINASTQNNLLKENAIIPQLDKNNFDINNFNTFFEQQMIISSVQKNNTFEGINDMDDPFYEYDNHLNGNYNYEITNQKINEIDFEKIKESAKNVEKQKKLTPEEIERLIKERNNFNVYDPKILLSLQQHYN